MMPPPPPPQAAVVPSSSTPKGPPDHSAEHSSHTTNLSSLVKVEPKSLGVPAFQQELDKQTLQVKNPRSSPKSSNYPAPQLVLTSTRKTEDRRIDKTEAGRFNTPQSLPETIDLKLNPSGSTVGQAPVGITSVISSSTNPCRVSKESGSSDDSSDGMSESLAINTKPRVSPIIPNNSSSDDESRKLSQKDSTTAPSTHSTTTPPPCNAPPTPHNTTSIPQSLVSATRPIKLDKKIVIKLKQLIRSEKGSPTIRKCQFISLSEANREKIFRQWRASKKRIAKQKKRNSTRSDSESSGTYF